MSYHINTIKVNPDPDVSSDPEIDILKDIFENDDEPSAPPSKFPDDTSLEFYDEEESIGNTHISISTYIQILK